MSLEINGFFSENYRTFTHLEAASPETNRNTGSDAQAQERNVAYNILKIDVYIGLKNSSKKSIFLRLLRIV